MIKLSSTWDVPPGSPPADIDRQYFDGRVALVRRLPRIRRHVVLKAVPGDDSSPEFWRGTPGCWRGEDIWFDSREDLAVATESPEWQVLAEDDFKSSVAGLQFDVFDVEEEYRTPHAFEPGCVSSGSAMIVAKATWRILDGQRPDDVERHYFDVHVPAVRSLPGLQRHPVLKAMEWPAGQSPRCWRSAENWFENREDFAAAMRAAATEWPDNDHFGESITCVHGNVFQLEDEWMPDR